MKFYTFNSNNLVEAIAGIATKYIPGYHRFNYYPEISRFTDQFCEEFRDIYITINEATEEIRKLKEEISIIKKDNQELRERLYPNQHIDLELD